MACYVVFTAVHVYPTWLTMIPASILLGLGAGPLWTAQATYITRAATHHARSTGIPEDASANRFFGIFVFAFSCGKCVVVVNVIIVVVFIVADVYIQYWILSALSIQIQIQIYFAHI
jgi:hypothetical protein